MLAAVVGGSATRVQAASDIILYTTDYGTINGNWSNAATSGAAGGRVMASVDNGWSSPNNPLAAPADYVEATFSAPAGPPYHVWARLRAGADSKFNDSVWVQFSDALDAGSHQVYPIGSTSGLLLNLQSCNGCALSGWGWLDGAYWLAQTNVVQFASSGTHTIRIQTREDGVSFDQVVLSPATYLSSAPGPIINDNTIVAKPQSGPPPSAVYGGTPYSGTASSIPGQINAAFFDNGGENVAYHDTTAGNSGGQFRSTDVDIQISSDGAYNVGWIAAGEWLNYTVSVGTSGSYSLQLRVASPGAATMHVGFSGASNVWSAVTIPATGGWQNWKTVTLNVTLNAGTQLMTLFFDTGGMNFEYVSVAGITSGGGPTPYLGSPVSLPGTVQAQNFDNGGEGVAYHDSTPGNTGGQARGTDVDIESSTDGGYDVGWTTPGEWLNYTVSVGTAGNYTVGLRVATPSGSTLHVGFNGPSAVWTTIAIPSTGGWQNWTTVNLPATLGAGTQLMTVLFDTGSVNLNRVVVSAAAPPPPPPPPPPPGSGTVLSVATWNIEINDNSETHARVAMDTILSIGPRPEVVVIQEAYSNLFNIYIDELQRQTGQTWHGVFATHCAVGNWNGSACTTAWYQGIGIFTTHNILDSNSMLFPFADCWTSARVGLRAAIDVGGTPVQVFTTHLQTGGCANDAQSRYSSMAMLKTWASGYPAPQLAAGDFNADPNQIDTSSGMLPAFLDTWSMVGSGSGYTALSGSPTMKLDYWFTDAGQRAMPSSTQVFLGSGPVSDHYPLQTTFTVR